MRYASLSMALPVLLPVIVVAVFCRPSLLVYVGRCLLLSMSVDMLFVCVLIRPSIIIIFIRSVRAHIRVGISCCAAAPRSQSQVPLPRTVYRTQCYIHRLRPQQSIISYHIISYVI